MQTQQSGEETFGRLSITLLLDEYIDDFAVLIHRTPQVVLLPVDIDKYFIEEERTPESTVTAFQAPGIFRAKLIAPKSDRLVTDSNATLRKQVFDIPMTEVEAIVEPNGMLNNLGRKPMAFILVFGRAHSLLSPRHR
ncbi:MAG: hypothetical protein ACRBC3_24075 [Burkholderiaceae bacterium]